MLCKFITDALNLSIPVFVIFISSVALKSFTDKPDENLADPVVGNT